MMNRCSWGISTSYKILSLTVMLLQPGYLPWIGFFEQVYRSDIFVIFDDAQYTKLDWRNRNRVKSTNGKDLYLTVPVQHPKTSTLIKDVKISYEQNWINKHRNILRSYYQNAPYFQAYYEQIVTILLKQHRFLIDLDVELIEVLLKILKIESKILYSSHLKTLVRGKERLLAVCQEVGATHCYNGHAGTGLYDPQAFLEKGINLQFQKFVCPEYPQLWGNFIPNLSIVDLLFNSGEKSRDILIQGGQEPI